MQKVEDYRPDYIEFTAESSEVPEHLGDFDTAKEAQKFMNDHFVALSTKFTAIRKIDDYEISLLRGEYVDELESELPRLKEIHEELEIQLSHIKDKEKIAREAVTASLNKIQAIGEEVREGTTDMNLDQAFTYEVAYNGKRYYYSIVDNAIRLVGVRTISDSEIDDLLNTSERNAQSFQELKNAVNG